MAERTQRDSVSLLRSDTKTAIYPRGNVDGPGIGAIVEGCGARMGTISTAPGVLPPVTVCVRIARPV